MQGFKVELQACVYRRQGTKQGQNKIRHLENLKSLLVVVVGGWSQSENSVRPCPLCWLTLVMSDYVRLFEVTLGFVSLCWRDRTWSSATVILVTKHTYIIWKIQKTVKGFQKTFIPVFPKLSIVVMSWFVTGTVRPSPVWRICPSETQ